MYSFSSKSLSVIADVGADILDLAETMITSNGLQYEPVSEACLRSLLILSVITSYFIKDPYLVN